MLTPENIYNKRFDKTRVSGYKTEDVDVFLEEVAKTVADLTAQNRELEEKIEVLAEKIEEYRSDEDNLKTAILGAQRLGDSVVREARHKAEVLINEAKAQAAEIVENAQSKIDREQVALTRLQREVALFKEKLIALYKEHLLLINEIPDLRDKKRPEKPAQPQPEQPAAEEMPAQEQAPAQEPEQPQEQEVPETVQASAPQEPSAPQPVQQENTANTRKEPIPLESKFGPLKFGAGFDLQRDDDPKPRKKR